MKNKISLLFGLLVVASMILSACGGGTATEAPAEQPAEQPDVQPPAAAPSAYNEAPMLAEMVAAGTLPPVDERLPDPEDIVVITPVDGVGEYGGTWHNTTWWQGMGNIEMAVYDPPVRWNSDYTDYEPGLLKSWEYSDDGTQLTWNWRRGIKWSDGVDFIPEEDMGYWLELAANDDFATVSWPWWGLDSDGTRFEVTFPDPYTMVMKWNEPHFIANFVPAQGFWEWLPMERPKHWLSQFDPNYDSSKTYDDLEAAVYGGDWLMNVAGYPCLHAWCPTEVTPGEKNCSDPQPLLLEGRHRRQPTALY
jgi:peptide/nickel transport system substrate-binding protein